MPLSLLNEEGKIMKLLQFSWIVSSDEHNAETHPAIIMNGEIVAMHLQYQLVWSRSL